MELLIQESNEKPDRFIPNFEDSCTDTVYVEGRLIVMGCPCKRAEKVMAFIDDHLDQIAKYVTERLSDITDELETNLAKAKLLEASLRSRMIAKENAEKSDVPF